MCDGIIRPSSRTYLCTFSNPSTITDAVLPGCRINYPDFDSLGTVWASSLEKELVAYIFPNQDCDPDSPLKYAKGWILELGAKYILVRRLSPDRERAPES